MKPTLQIPPSRRRKEFNHETLRGRALLTDYSFQAGAGDPFGHGNYGRNPDDKPPSSHLVSPDYFRTEMQREFFVEAIAFAVIVVVAAWPIAALIHLIVARFID